MSMPRPSDELYLRPASGLGHGEAGRTSEALPGRRASLGSHRLDNGWQQADDFEVVHQSDKCGPEALPDSILREPVNLSNCLLYVDSPARLPGTSSTSVPARMIGFRE